MAKCHLSIVLSGAHCFLTIHPAFNIVSCCDFRIVEKVYKHVVFRSPLPQPLKFFGQDAIHIVVIHIQNFKAKGGGAIAPPQISVCAIAKRAPDNGKTRRTYLELLKRLPLQL